MKALITGITGLAGSYLAELLVKKGYKVVGIDLDINVDNIKGIIEKIKLQECDIRQKKIVTDIIKDIKPDLIFHLAGITRGLLPELYQTDVIGTMNVFEAVKALRINPLILVTGSSAEYGLVYPHENPISEQNSLRPVTPYGVSKTAQSMLGFQYFKNYGLKIIRTRAFNNTAPRERSAFVCSNFARQIAEIEKGIKKPIVYVGNTKSIRDFTDTRDVVRAYYLVFKKGRVGDVYNVCSGKGYPIQSILDMLLKMSKMKIKLKHQKSRMKEYDVPEQIGNYSKIRKATGWSPKIQMEKTLKDLLEYWRKRA